MLGIPGLAKLGVQYLQSLGYSEAVEVVADADAKKSLSFPNVHYRITANFLLEKHNQQKFSFALLTDVRTNA